MSQPADNSRPLLTRRSRTPSDLKWLLNERAALVGQAQSAAERQQALERRVAGLNLRLQQASSELAAVREHTSAIATRIGAIDRTLGLMHPGANPAAAGCVRAQAGRYGARGALTEFVGAHLRSIAPKAILGAEIQKLAVARFELNLVTPVERAKFKCTLRTVLRQLRDRHGVLETVENWQGQRPQPLWRWRQPAPSLDALRALASAAEASDDAPPHPHPL